MVYELTAVILNQIVSGRKSVLEAYGEIVFKAWRAATGACLERIETHLIQNVSELLPCDPQQQIAEVAHFSVAHFRSFIRCLHHCQYLFVQV